MMLKLATKGKKILLESKVQDTILIKQLAYERSLDFFPSLVTRSGLDFSEFHHHTQNTVDFVKEYCKDHCKVLPKLRGGSCTAKANPTGHERFTAGVSIRGCNW